MPSLHILSSDDKTALTLRKSIAGAPELSEQQPVMTISDLALDYIRTVGHSNVCRVANLAHNIIEALFQIDLFFEVFLFLAKTVAQFLDLAESKGIVDCHRHLIRHLHQHLGFALRKCRFQSAGDHNRADYLALPGDPRLSLDRP